jgi:hypothetical protein
MSLYRWPPDDDSHATDHQHKSESEVAWALAKAVEDRLDPIDRAKMYATLGAGETFRTIAVLLRLALHRRVPLTAKLLADVDRWLNGYRETDDEVDLRDLLDRLRALPPAAPRASAQEIPPRRPRQSTTTSAQVFTRRLITPK